MKQKADSLKMSIKLTSLKQDWQRKTEKTQIAIIRNETGDIIGDSANIKRAAREHSDQLTHIWQLRRNGSIPKNTNYHNSLKIKQITYMKETEFLS